MEALDYEYEIYLDEIDDGDEDYMETIGCQGCNGCFDCLMMSWKDFI
jgi:hypothetical protein